MEEKYEFLIEEADDGCRMDAVLARMMEEASRSYIQKLIEGGFVSVNGVVVSVKKRRLSAGERVELRFREPEPLSAIPEQIPLEIIYEDGDLLVVNKPKGMVVHPAAGSPSGTLVNAVLWHCRGNLSSINGVIRPGIVHRIDKDTSGLLVVAKSDRAHRGLAQQLAVHSMTRIYAAVVWHNIREEEGTVTGNIGRDPKNRLRMAVVEEGGKHAVTHYRVSERFGSHTLIEAKLETGRTHQIRVHMAFRNHPLLGDVLYGPGKQPFGLTGQVLHAGTLGFVHPITGNYLEFRAPLPEEFCRILEKLRT